MWIKLSKCQIQTIQFWLHMYFYPKLFSCMNQNIALQFEYIFSEGEMYTDITYKIID